MINVFQPSLGAEELQAVGQVFASNWVGRGKVTDQFEQAFARHCGVPQTQMRSVSCCTEGLFQAMTLLGVGPGDEVVLPTLSFVGAGNAIANSGARPVFCDVDCRTLNATAETIAACLTPKTRAVLVLHYGGVPCVLDPIVALLSERGIPLIEDSACSVASTYHGRACGAIGDVGVWSFDAMKILVTGDGGMIYSRHPEDSERLERLLYLGMEQSSGFSQKKGDRWWQFEVSEFGRRAIMNDIASAIGLEQLRKLPAFIARRRQVHTLYDEALASLGWLRPPPAIPPDVESSYYFYWVQMESSLRDRLAVHLRSHDIYVTFRYHPLHQVKAFGSSDRLPKAETVAETTLCLPIHQSLLDDDVARVVDCIAGIGL